MAAIILEQQFASEERQAILEAERAAARLGVLPDDKEKRALIINRMKQRLAEVGWGFNREETVVQTDDRGVAHIVPKSQAAGWMEGLPAHRGTRDVTSRKAVQGRQTPRSRPFFFDAPPPIPKVDPRVAAERFHARLANAMERYGTIPSDLARDLSAEGWRQGQPVPREKLDEWCRNFQIRWHAKYGTR